MTLFLLSASRSEGSCTCSAGSGLWVEPGQWGGGGDQTRKVCPLELNSAERDLAKAKTVFPSCVLSVPKCPPTPTLVFGANELLQIWWSNVVSFELPTPFMLKARIVLTS
jgi:hypothetical protein